MYKIEQLSGSLTSSPFRAVGTGLVLALGVGASGTAWADEVSVTPWGQGWALGGHAGQAVHETVKSGEAFNPFVWDFRDYYIVSTGLQKELVDFWGYSKLYAEANVSYIFGDEHYFETFLTPSISWEPSPGTMYSILRPISVSGSPTRRKPHGWMIRARTGCVDDLRAGSAAR